MESIKHSVVELTQHFISKMEEFKKIKSSIKQKSSSNTTSPPKILLYKPIYFVPLCEVLWEDFSYKSSWWQNNEILKCEAEREFYYRIVLGKTEKKIEAQVVIILFEHLKISNLCRQLVKTLSGKPRLILVKFRNYSLRNQISYLKTSLKGTRVTLSAFFT